MYEGACGRILDFESRGERLRRACCPRGDGSHWLSWQVLGQAAGGTGVVVTLPLESTGGVQSGKG